MSLSKNNSKTEKKELLKKLANGYKEMAEINLEMAQEGVVSDNESLSLCEEKLTECE